MPETKKKEVKKPAAKKAAAPAKKAAAPAAAPAKKAVNPARKAKKVAKVAARKEAAKVAAADPAKKAAAPAKKAAAKKAPAKKTGAAKKAPAKKAAAKKVGVLAKKAAPPMKAKKVRPTKVKSELVKSNEALKRKACVYNLEAGLYKKNAAKLEKKEKKTRKEKKYASYAIKRAAHLVKKAKNLKSHVVQTTPKKTKAAAAVEKKPRKVVLRRRLPKALNDPKKMAIRTACKEARKKLRAEAKTKKTPKVKRVKTMALKPGQYRIWKGTKEVIKKKNYIVKPIGGANNGNARRVLVSKRPAYYAAQLNPKRKPKRDAKTVTKKLRPTITPGTVCILVAGVHKGKRVVFLKRLDSGLCLVSGPFKVNSCPLRRVNQIFLIATATKIDISKVDVPEHINDNYFRRAKAVRAKKEEGDIFDQKTEKYVASEQRKTDQAKMDTQLLASIRQRKDKEMLLNYLGSYFGLRNRMYPHQLKF